MGQKRPPRAEHGGIRRAPPRPRKAVTLDAAAFCAGLLLPYGFSPTLFAFMPVLSLGLLFVTWSSASWRRAAWRGWLFGLGAFGNGVSWVQESFQYSQITGVLSLVLASVFIASLALFPAAVGAFAVRFAPTTRIATSLLWFPAVWVLGEWLRGSGVAGFAWLQAGYALVDSPLAGLFALFGVYGASWWCALAGGLIAALVASSRRAVAPLSVGVATLVLLGVIAQLWSHESWTRPSGARLDVALVQGNVAQGDKWKKSMRAPTLARYKDLTEQHLGADLVIWPETAVPGLWHEMRDYLHEMAGLTARNGTALMTGIPVFDASERRFFNSVILLGEEPGWYHKRHLVPFGEYLPFAPVLSPVVRTLGIQVAEFSRGATVQPPIRLRGHGLGVFICYEVSFGEEVRSALPEAAFLVTVSNDAWFGTSLGPHQHLQIARARALENGRWLVRATNTGLTAVVDPRGVVREALPQFQSGVLRTSIQPRRGATPYSRFGDWPALGAALLAVVAAFCWSYLRPGRFG